MPELRRPDRADYATDSDWLDSCIIEADRYTRAMIRAIDGRSSVYPSFDRRKSNAYDEQRKYGHVKTLNDWLQDKPELLAKVKRDGIGALFEI